MKWLLLQVPYHFVPDGNPYTHSGIGFVGTKRSMEAIHDWDILIIVGSSFPYIEFYACPELDIIPNDVSVNDNERLISTKSSNGTLD
jgi:thiamine pyrophosphate-dependent acetolactate synthase large subunit-like protein